MLLLDEPTETDQQLSDPETPVDPPDEADGDDGAGGGPGPWVTVATFWNPTEAHVARIKLESEDIDCVIVDENLVATQWLWATALGGIKLQVPATKAVRAHELLETSAARAAIQPGREPLFDGQVRCPRCGSEDIYHSRFSRRASFISILLLGIPLPFVQHRTRCAACGFEWKQA